MNIKSSANNYLFFVIVIKFAVKICLKKNASVDDKHGHKALSLRQLLHTKAVYPTPCEFYIKTESDLTTDILL